MALLLTPLAPTHAATAHRAPIVVPFDGVRDQILVQVSLGGRGPFTMVLDSGTNPSAVDLAFAQRLGARIDTVRQAGEGAGQGDVLGYRSDLLAVALSGVHADTVVALAINLAPLSRKLARDVVGVLGFSFLDDRVIRIDYPRHRVTFYPDGLPPAPARPKGQRVEYPMRLDEDHTAPTLPVRLPVGVVPMILDSGSSASLWIYGAAIRPLGLETAYRRASIDSVTSYGRRAAVRRDTLDDIAIGTIRFGKVGVTFGAGEFGDSADVRRQAGSVGNAMLRDCVVTLDYRRRLVSIER